MAVAHKAIAAMGSARYWDDVEIRFPLAYVQPINQAAKKAGIENYLLFALARRKVHLMPQQLPAPVPWV